MILSFPVTVLLPQYSSITMEHSVALFASVSLVYLTPERPQTGGRFKVFYIKKGVPLVYSFTNHL